MKAARLHRPELKRRTFLKGAGITLALPFLEAMRPAFASARGVTDPAAPRRMLAVMTDMGILPQNYFPKTAGANWEGTPYLDVLKDFRRDMTVLSGVSHPDVDGGHHADIAFLTAAPHPGRGGFRNSISLDQTAVLDGTNMGNANAHSNDNLPVLLAAGGFKYGQHLAFDAKRNEPLANLFVTLLQRLGIEESKFASGTKTLPGLEMT